MIVPQLYRGLEHTSVITNSSPSLLIVWPLFGHGMQRSYVKLGYVLSQLFVQITKYMVLEFFGECLLWSLHVVVQLTWFKIIASCITCACKFSFAEIYKLRSIELTYASQNTTVKIITMVHQANDESVIFNIVYSQAMSHSQKINTYRMSLQSIKMFIILCSEPIITSKEISYALTRTYTWGIFSSN